MRRRGVPGGALLARLPLQQLLLLPASPACGLPWLHRHRSSAVHGVRTRHHRRDKLGGRRHRLARRRPLFHARTRYSTEPNCGVHLRPQPRRQGGFRARAGPRQDLPASRGPHRRRPRGRHRHGQPDAPANPSLQAERAARPGASHDHRHGPRRAASQRPVPAVRASGREPRGVLRRVCGAGVPPRGEGLRAHRHDGRRDDGRQGAGHARPVQERRGQGAHEAVRRRRHGGVPQEVGTGEARVVGCREGANGCRACGAVRGGVPR